MASTHCIGVDIGGTNIKISLIHTGTWIIEESDISPTPKDFRRVVEKTIELVTRYRNGKNIPVGVCVPGPVKQPEGLLLRAPNIPNSENIPLRTILSEALQSDVPVGNDARCFALAEAVLGAGRSHRVVCGVIIGTGVGGGLVVDKKVYEGANGFAGEVGHMLLQPGNPPFPTDDKRGEVEQFLSGTAFAERCKAALSPEDYLNGEACAFLHPNIYKEVAWLCTNITHAYDPSIIIFGGSMGKALKPHVKKIEEELPHWLLPSVPAPVLAFAEKEHPGTFGAALLTIQQ